VFRPSAESAGNRSHGGPAPRLTRSPHQRNRKPTDTALCQSQCGPNRYQSTRGALPFGGLAKTRQLELLPSGRPTRELIGKRCDLARYSSQF
jgi:hypothetical protein